MKITALIILLSLAVFGFAAPTPEEVAAEMVVEGQAIPKADRSRIYSGLVNDRMRASAWERSRIEGWHNRAPVNLEGILDAPAVAMATRWAADHAKTHKLTPDEGWDWYLNSFASGTLLTWDIETLPTDYRKHDWATVEAAQDQLIAVTRATRGTKPDALIGFYGVMPNRDYWTPVDTHAAALRLIEAAGGKITDRTDPAHVTTARSIAAKVNATTPETVRRFAGIFEVKDKSYQEWQAANARLRYGREDGKWTGGLAAEVDYVAPSLYVFYAGAERNAIYARHNLAEAKRYGKRVIVYGWMRYHNSNATLRGQLLDPADWHAVVAATFAGGHDLVLWDDWSLPWTDHTYRLLAMTLVLREQPGLSLADTLKKAEPMIAELRSKAEGKQ